MSGRSPSEGFRRLIGIFGNSGTGKTQTLRAVAREWARRFHFDKSRELLEGVDVQFVAYSRGEVLDYLSGLKEDHDFSIAYQPVIVADSDHDALVAEADECGFLARLALAARNSLFTVDEASRCCRQNYVSYSTVALALEGRKNYVSGLYAGQRPVHVVKDIRTECYSSETYTYRLEDSDDREDIHKRYGRIVADEVGQFLDLHGIRISRPAGQHRKIERVLVVPDARNPALVLSPYTATAVL